MFSLLALMLVGVVAVACALSSTAISVKLYQDMGISASSGARMALGVWGELIGTRRIKGY